MTKEGRILNDVRMLAIENVKVNYGPAVGYEKAMTVIDENEGRKYRILIGHLRGHEHISTEGSALATRLRMDVVKVRHEEDGDLWEAMRLVYLNKSGESEMIFSSNRLH